jgi:tRNA-Thr(GGU) m(6)t(6)A37 methyltransferase TsaA
MTKQSIAFDIIGKVHSPYKEKFAIPRQPGLVTSALGKIQLLPPYNDINCLRGIEQYSHLWLSFVFHQTAEQGWKPLVRPPRLGGNKKQGVFATRSTFRPNPLGLSVVKFESIEQNKQGLFINIRGLDLLDQTPIIDIKPYLPYADALSQASSTIAQSPDDNGLSVSFSSIAQRQLKLLQASYPELEQFITQVVSQDPRPAYKKDKQDQREYGMCLYNLNIRWHLELTNQQQNIPSKPLAIISDISPM